MDGTRSERPEGPLTRRIHRLGAPPVRTMQRPPQGLVDAYHRILTELERGEWRLDEWADELGISEDEMLIELDRHLHQQRAA